MHFNLENAKRCLTRIATEYNRISCKEDTQSTKPYSVETSAERKTTSFICREDWVWFLEDEVRVIDGKALGASED